MSNECIVYWCHDEPVSRGHCNSHYYHVYQKGEDRRLCSKSECNWCGSEYRYDPGSGQQHCNACRYVSCEWCGQTFRRSEQGRRFCSVECSNDSMRNWFTCENCGEETYGRRRTHDGEQFHKRRFCNRDCYQEWSDGPEKVPERQVMCRSCRMQFVVAWSEYRSYCSHGCRARGAYHESCGWCGDRFYGDPQAIYCGYECKVEEAKRRAREMYEPKAPWEPFNCAECGEYVDPGPGDRRRRFCSIRCNDTYWSSTEMSRKEREYLGERDGWVCGICGDSVDRRCSVPHERAPVVDHIVPRARGGSDDRRNLQIAHFGCNSDKSDGAAGSQLMLIG